MYLWQAPDWPAFRVDGDALLPVVAAARRAQGAMLARAASLQLLDLAELQLSGWAEEALATAQIEGEVLPLHSVRASAARRLGLPDATPALRDVRTEATLDVLEGVVSSWDKLLAAQDLFAWHAALFPTGRSGLAAIAVGRWRSHAEPMQIVTPRIGRSDIVHYEAPPSPRVPGLMDEFLAWFEATRALPAAEGLVRAALAHLWFEAIHPFEDGNGRIGRAVAELALAQDMRSPQRLFSLSRQLWLDRKGYYAQLQAATGQGSMDVTAWVLWFVGRIGQACDAACSQMDAAQARGQLWQRLNAADPALSPSQKKALARMSEAGPDGFANGISTEKYVNLTGVSRATAWRELTALAEQGWLDRKGQGRGTRYLLRH